MFEIYLRNKRNCVVGLRLEDTFACLFSSIPGYFYQHMRKHMENIPWAHWIRPERWWTMPDQVEVRGNPDGGPKQFWRANRLSELGIGAKDQSNHLVAGSFRSFPQDSWSIEWLHYNSYLVKRMIRGLRNEMFLTYSQTLNGYVSQHTWMMLAFSTRKCARKIVCAQWAKFW